MTQLGERFLSWGSSPPKSCLRRRALSCMSATIKFSSSACMSESASESKSDKDEEESDVEEMEDRAEAETKVGKLSW